MIKYILLFYYLTTALLPRKVRKNGCPNCHNCHSPRFFSLWPGYYHSSTR